MKVSGFVDLTPITLSLLVALCCACLPSGVSVLWLRRKVTLLALSITSSVRLQVLRTISARLNSMSRKTVELHATLVKVRFSSP